MPFVVETSANGLTVDVVVRDDTNDVYGVLNSIKGAAQNCGYDACVDYKPHGWLINDNNEFVVTGSHGTVTLFDEFEPTQEGDTVSDAVEDAASLVAGNIQYI